MKSFIQLAKKKKREKQDKRSNSNAASVPGTHHEFHRSKRNWEKSMKKKHHSSSESDSDNEPIPLYLRDVKKSTSHSSSISWDEYGQFAPIETANPPLTTRSLEETKRGRYKSKDKQRYSMPSTPRSTTTTFSNDGSIYSEVRHDVNKCVSSQQPIIFDFVAVDGNNIIAYQGKMVRSLKRHDDDWWKIKTFDGEQGLVSSNLITSNQIFPERPVNQFLKHSHTLPKTNFPMPSSVYNNVTNGYHDTGPVRDSPKYGRQFTGERASKGMEDCHTESDLNSVQCIYEVPDEKLSYRANLAQLLQNGENEDREIFDRRFYGQANTPRSSVDQMAHNSKHNSYIYSESYPTSEASSLNISIKKRVPSNMEELDVTSQNIHASQPNSPRVNLLSYNEHRQKENIISPQTIEVTESHIRNSPCALMQELNLEGKIFRPIKNKNDITLI